MDTVKGYGIIARKAAVGGGEIMLGASKSRYSYTGFEYVTAWLGKEGEMEWADGHYFEHLDFALSDYNKRA